MTNKKNARPGAATPERAREMAALDGATIPKNHFTTPNDQISRLLSTGRSSAIPLDTLRNITNLDGRTVRSMIRAERLRGIPILSDNMHGYYLPADDIERAEFVRSMRHRAREIMRAADVVENGGALNEKESR